jgi:hypothetical protein
MIGIYHAGYYWWKQEKREIIEQNATIMAVKIAAIMKKTEPTPALAIEKEKRGEWPSRENKLGVQKDYITERLKFLTELFKLCWLSVLGVGGGAISLLSGPFDRWRYGWASAAAVLLLFLLALLWHTHRKMNQLWTELRKGQNHDSWISRPRLSRGWNDRVRGHHVENCGQYVAPNLLV